MSIENEEVLEPSESVSDATETEAHEEVAVKDETAGEERTAPIEEGSDDILDDDENFLNAQDEILEHSTQHVIAQQPEGVVTWDIEGLYNENGKVLNKYLLRLNPPKLVVQDSNGEQAEFLITKDLSDLLSQQFEIVSKAYHGIRPPSELTLGEKAKGFVAWLKANKMKATILGALAATILIMFFIPR